MSSSRQNSAQAATFKVVLIGDTAVGKSAMLDRLKRDQFKGSYSPTIGPNFRIKEIKQNKQKVKLQIWDTAGQERFYRIVENYYKGARAYVFVYDVTDVESFNRPRLEAEYIRGKGLVDTPMILLGSKSDLDKKRQVTEQEAEKFAEDNGLTFYGEVSAKTGKNVEGLASFLAEKIEEKYGLRQEQDSSEEESINWEDGVSSDEKAGDHQVALSRVFGGSIGTVLGAVAAIGLTLMMASIGPIGWAMIGIAAGIIVAGTVCGVLGADVVMEYQYQAARYEQKNNIDSGFSSSSDIYQGLGTTPEPTIYPANIAKAIEQCSNPYENAFEQSPEDQYSATSSPKI